MDQVVNVACLRSPFSVNMPIKYQDKWQRLTWLFYVYLITTFVMMMERFIWGRAAFAFAFQSSTS